MLVVAYSAYLPSTFRNCPSYMPGLPGLMMPIGSNFCFTISRTIRMASLRRGATEIRSGPGALALGAPHGETPGLGFLGVGSGDLVGGAELGGRPGSAA